MSRSAELRNGVVGVVGVGEILVCLTIDNIKHGIDIGASKSLCGPAACWPGSIDGDISRLPGESFVGEWRDWCYLDAASCSWE